MTSQSVQPYLEQFESLAAGRAGEPAGLAAARTGALDVFAEVGFPSTRDEEWRHTNLGPLMRSDFALHDSHNSVSVEDAEAQAYDGSDLLVFVNGRWSGPLSRVGDLPAGALVYGLADARAMGSPVLDEHLARWASWERHPFVALNTALHHDGAVIAVASGVVLERPIQILYLSTDGLSTDGGTGRVAYPRNLIVAGANSQVKVIESYVGLGAEACFNCAVTEIVGGPSSHIEHYKIQKESHSAFHISTQQAQLERSAVLKSVSISEGGALVRNDVNAVLDDEGVECTLNGLYVATDRQFVDNHMRVEHAKPHCNSHELYKGVLDGHSRAVFNGRIYVHPDAQKTDAKQTNRNLLLSGHALVNSNPQLEIFADDVRCTHGSTVGQLDEEAIFYLRSRGIPHEAARSLLTWAFANELVETIGPDSVRHDVEEMLFARLASADTVRQAT